MPGIRRVPLRSPALPPPTWKHDFRYGAVPRGATYTGSGGTYFNSSGVLTSATTNVPRFDYDPATLSPLGYLAEMASTNNAIRSRTISNWTAVKCTVTDNAVTSPDGTQNASTIIEDGTTGAREVDSPTGGSVVTSSIYGVSVFIKNVSGSRWAKITLNGAGGSLVNFQPSTGTLGTLGANVASVNARSIGNGWYRVSFLYTSGFTAAVEPRVFMGTADNATVNPSYTGDSTSGYSIFGMQVDTAGVGVTSYIPTAAATASRTQDVLSLPLTSLPGWSATQGGVLVAAYRLHTVNPSSPGYAQSPVYLNDGSFNNAIRMLANDGNGAFGANFCSGGTTRSAVSGSSPAAFARRKQAVGWDVNKQQIYYDGTFFATGTQVVALPVSPTTLDIGRYTSQGLNGTLESIAYYRGARYDAFVQAVSRG